MLVHVHRINIPALSTIGYAEGVIDPTGEHVRFAGDHRPMRRLGEILRRLTKPLQVDLEDWQIVEIGGGAYGTDSERRPFGFTQQTGENAQ